ncbi:MAG: 1-acyl-sn-glycerol-3-phosphate acyltransferase [bacterium]|nr:1-acyl-sn-glycerol-3-phosphate acyltransferase [bacterium]
MLDLPRLQRLKFVRRPFSQRFFGQFLHANYCWFPGVELPLENPERIPDEPVLFAMNHTDRYNYFPFQYTLWKKFDRFTATWVKGKYYENGLLARFMESMFQLPTVSRGYLITRDFVSVLGRMPTALEYTLLREAVDARAVGEAGTLPVPPDVPEMLLRKRRNPLGVAHDPEEADYADYICTLFHAMMRRFVELNREACDVGLDLLVFPQGTRSTRLLPGHTGIAQMALHLEIPIVPIGCNGSDHVYPGGSPFGKKGRITYRVGDPIHYSDLAAFHIEEDYAPFSATAERDFSEQFKAVAALVTDRIESMLDSEYQRNPKAESAEERGAERFV